MTNKSPYSTTELDLLQAAIEIGDIADADCNYTTLLAKTIDAVGKSVNDLTIGELLRLHKICSGRHNMAAERIQAARFDLCTPIFDESGATPAAGIVR